MKHNHHAYYLGVFGLVVLGALTLYPIGSSRLFPNPPAPPHTALIRNAASGPLLAASYGKHPLSFEPNQGQTNSQVKFLSRGSGYTLYLMGNAAALSLKKPSAASRRLSANHLLSATTDNGLRTTGGLLPPLIHNPRSQIINPPTLGPQNLARDVVRLELVGADADAKVVGLDPLPGASNYFIGNDPKKWRTNVTNYAKVKYESVYPGIDLLYYGNQGRLEYDWIVAPGADPRAIAFNIEGADKVEIDAAGDLVLKSGSGDVRLHKPVVYQPSVVSSQSPVVQNLKSRVPNPGLVNVQASIFNRQLVDGRFVLRRAGSEIRNLMPKSAISPDPRPPTSDPSFQVVIDVGHYDRRQPLVIDPSVEYAAFDGGAGSDVAYGIAVDSAGNAYITGTTQSADFPTQNPFQSAHAGGTDDVFVTKVNAAGSAIVYSTYLGGYSIDQGYGIAVDSAGSAYVTGYTVSSDFPHTEGAYDTTCGADGNCGGPYASFSPAPDCFVTKFDPSGSSLAYSTFLGGSDQDVCAAITLDDSNNVYVTGSTLSTADFPLVDPGGLSSPSKGAFVTKINAAGTDLIYSLRLGGGFGTGMPSSIAVDATGSAYIAFAASAGFAVTPGTVQGTSNDYSGGGLDAFVEKLNPDGSAVVYATYLGGNNTDWVYGVAVDATGNAYVTGPTQSNDFPTTPRAFHTSTATGTCYDYETYEPYPCWWDSFVTKLNPAGTAKVYSTYLTGVFGAGATSSIAVDASGNAYMSGTTSSNSLPLRAPLQRSLGGGSDMFLATLNSGGRLLLSSYIGGNGYEYGTSLALDKQGGLYVAGWTYGTSKFLVTRRNFNISYLVSDDGTYHGGGNDALVVKISRGSAPSVGVSQINVTDAEQPAGATSVPTPMTVGNFTSEPLNATDIRTDNPYFTVDPQGCLKIFAVGEECVVAFDFKRE